MDKLKEQLDKVCKVREDLIVERDRLEVALNMAHDDNLIERENVERAEERAALYEKEYNALLDRLFARGEAK